MCEEGKEDAFGSPQSKIKSFTFNNFAFSRLRKKNLVVWVVKIRTVIQLIIKIAESWKWIVCPRLSARLRTITHLRWHREQQTKFFNLGSVVTSKKYIIYEIKLCRTPAFIGFNFVINRKCEPHILIFSFSYLWKGNSVIITINFVKTSNLKALKLNQL